MNYNQRHNYYVTRTIKWLESINYVARKVESNYCITVNDRQVYVKQDFWGADVACRNGESCLFLQVKTSAAQVSKGAAQLTTDTAWPAEIGRYVVWWDKGSRLAGGPNIAQIVCYYGPEYSTCHLSQEPQRYYRCNLEAPGCKRWPHKGDTYPPDKVPLEI